MGTLEVILFATLIIVLIIVARIGLKPTKKPFCPRDGIDLIKNKRGEHICPNCLREYVITKDGLKEKL